jgi:hypothetical protein
MSFCRSARRRASLPLAANVLQRRSAHGSQPDLGKRQPCSIQRSIQGQTHAAAEPMMAPPVVYEALTKPGSPLEPQVRSMMEARFDRDFSRVRVHADERAAASSSAVDAVAFTVGRDVFFSAGQYQPKTRAGQSLLAHELAHVVQQERAPRSRTNLEIGTIDSPAEREAGRMATAGDQEQSGTMRTPVESHRLQRQPRHPGSTLPYREALEETERGLFKEYSRSCAGIRLLRRLERNPPSLVERIRGLEKRIRVLPKLFEFQREIRRLPTPEQRMLAQKRYRETVEGPFPKFPPGYALLSEKDELARARCELSKARWELVAQQRSGTIPGRRLLRRP